MRFCRNIYLRNCAINKTMKKRWIGILAAAVALSTFAWAIIMVVSESGSPQVDSLEDKIDLIRSQSGLYTACYLNAALLTLFTVLFMSAIYASSQERDYLWSTIAFAFVPIYGLANLVAYLSQVFLVPTLLQLYEDPASQATAKILLKLAIHTWPGSAIEALNGMAYAVLGIPSIVFSLIFMRTPRLLQIGGFLLALSGVMSIVAFIGLLTSIGYLTLLSVAGGVVFLISLFPISIHFLKLQ